MKISKENGICGLQNVYTLETLEDWDEYEALCLKKDPEFFKWNPNFYLFKKDFEKYIHKHWYDKDNIRYKLNDEPVYNEYEVVAIQDDDSMADWYWYLKNVNNPNDIKYLLVSSNKLKLGLKENE